ncbi:hypothetical protein [Ectothiorhodospira shaposhnikovii]|uniref:hypothetical protein n=1 Tax=Ectothiorhodospira shaposhnikovii TaxID=1054 RepID=UPI001EE88D9A|nr:hypothetical protein [Ectothiorhodospira shaposhnikovii]MCG5513641.1 hypothetical protein [Ectothiorhodospira shaposhnikovii]
MNTDQTLRALHAVHAVASEARQGASPATLADALALAVERLAGPLEAAGVTRDQVAAAFAVTTVEDAHGPRPTVARARPTVAADDNGQPVAVPAWRPADDAQDRVGRLLAALLYLEAMAAIGEALPAGTAAYLDTTARQLERRLEQFRGDRLGQARRGSASKGKRKASKPWAELARELLEAHPGVPVREHWDTFPDAEEAGDDPTFGPWIIYRDGTELVAVDDRNGKQCSLSFSGFEKAIARARKSA